MADPIPTIPGTQIQDLTGQRFGRWVVAGFAERRPVGSQFVALWRCRCDCGTGRDVRGGDLKNGKSVSCGCVNAEAQAAKVDDLTGRRFGRWLVLARAGSRKKRPLWLCRCGCPAATEKVVMGRWLINGHSTSCGCWKAEDTGNRMRTHGLSRSAEYHVWTGMLNRCRNPNATGYADYGGRGVRVCERWHDFENFLADMGPRPSKLHSLERIDGNGHYEPGNVRWATAAEQNRNTSRNRMHTLNGETLTTAEWAARLGITPSALDNRLRGGWPIEKALSTAKLNHNRCGNRTCDSYKIWLNIRYRCTNPKNHSYPSYGGRGIRVCQRWLESYHAFCEDMGPRPSPQHSIDRINNDGDYEPDNCRWATAKEQANNTSRSRMLTLNGRTQTLRQWAEELGVSSPAITTRLARGWSITEALSTPFRKQPAQT